jgi:clan AA aspartic protease
VTATISNPADLTRKWSGLIVVDTGAIDCMAPGAALREIGMTPVTKRTYELADGSEIKLDVGVGQIEFLGDIVGVTAIFGPDDCEPILGVTALESTGIVVDPKTSQLKRLPAVPLKPVRQPRTTTR